MPKFSTIKLFLKWFFIPYGVTKVHPAMTLRYFPGAPPGSIETIAEGKLAKILKEQECVVCGAKCWARNKKAPPICTIWPCYKEYYTKPHPILGPYTMLTEEKFLEDMNKENRSNCDRDPN